MYLSAALAIFIAGSQLATAIPTPEEPRRLIKSSESDPGQWVTEQEEFDLFTSQGIGFVDITDITDTEVLEVLSGSSSNLVGAQAVTYPSSLTHVAEANSLITQVNNSGPQSWLQTLTKFNNRHYQSTTGTESATWLFQQVASIASTNPAITVSQFKHSFNQPSIIARIPGAKSDLVIVGAHFDSTAGSRTARSPGADDNGSASVVILEALRVLARSGFQPQNTLEFHWYGGEEGGLLGSKDVFANYKSTGKNVLGFLNQDMTGYSPSNAIAIYTDYVDQPFTAYVSLIASKFTDTTPVTSRCGYACSDHGSARSNGFPAAFVTEDIFDSSSPYIHSSRDTYETIMWPAMLRHSRFTVGFLVEASYL